MVAMVVVAVILVVLIGVVGGVWLIRRRADDEVQSIDGYRHTLSTLQDLRRRSSGGSVRVLEPSSSRPSQVEDDRLEADVEAEQEPVGRHLAPPSHPIGDPAPRQVDGAPGPGGSRRAQDRAMTAMNHRPRHLVAPIVMACVVILLAVTLAVIGARHHGSGPSTTTAAAPRSTAPPTTAGSGAAHPPPTTTTTAPTQFTPVAGATPSAATYSPPTASYTLVVNASSGDCWVQVQTTANGSTLYAQTVPAGQVANVAVSGASTLQLGSPSSVSVTLDSEPVVLPSGFQSPLELTFQPVGSA